MSVNDLHRGLSSFVFRVKQITQNLLSARVCGFESHHRHHDGVTKKMSLHFFQYSCGFAGFLERNPKNGFTVDVQPEIRR